MVWSSNQEDCQQYLESAEWVRLSDLINDWCQSDATCREIKKLAILGACERGELEYTRSDGKDFADPVMDLHSRGLLLINKNSFYEWKQQFEAKDKPAVKPPQSLKDFLKNIDDEYISVEDVLNLLHAHLEKDSDFKNAVALLLNVLKHTSTPPPVYQKNELQEWRQVALSQDLSAGISGKQKNLNMVLHVANQIIQENERKLLDDDLPF